MLENIDPIQLIIVFLPLLFAVTIHEVAHGYVALRFGDETAKNAGRLTLNPVRHLDPFGSVILPLILRFSGAPFVFGWAKPVPVDFRQLRPSRLGALCVSAAGITTNFLAAFACAGILQAMRPFLAASAATSAAPVLTLAVELLVYSVMINLVLGIFNLIPVPPLDGGRILGLLLPARFQRLYQSIEPAGILILIVLLMTNFLDLLFSFLIFPLVTWLLQGYL
jgi:Zn-dependent protease